MAHRIHTEADYMSRLWAANMQGLQQASFYFAEHPYKFVIVVATAGPVWSFAVVDRSGGSKFSPHVDTTYRETPEQEGEVAAIDGTARTHDSGDLHARSR